MKSFTKYFNPTVSFLMVLLLSCSIHNRQKSKASEYLMVDAKTKAYHKDGTRSYNDYQPFKTRTINLLADYQQPKQAPDLSIYGGDMSQQVEATGYFHVKKVGSRWWAIDPLGYKYVNIGLNSVKTGKTKVSKDALQQKFGSKENWTQETMQLLHNHGFNCAGSWSDTEAIIAYNKTAERPIAYTVNWSFMSSYGKKRGGTYMQPGHTGYPQDAIFVFDPEFESFCDTHAQQLAKLKDDPHLFGHFSDNEMPFKFKALDNYLSLPTDDYGYMAAIKWLKDNGISKDSISNKNRAAFMALVADKYFSTVAKAIKKYDPNHMYIGARFYSNEKNHAAFMKAAGKHLDLISTNYYNYWTPDSAQMDNWTKWTNKPFIITEYYTKGEDSGMGNTSGAGWIVRTQKDRGLFYQNYTLALLESKNCVGWHYFKYMDNDPNAKGVDPSNIDANKGIVTATYEPWTPMLDEMKPLNLQVYHLIKYLDHK
ncbi:agarase [Saccharicrinis fermentans]|uniref:Agarase n=1 Tax=Saccharicrinis fermentans DSM 9555 = JCM 21142 TaxID=869213 RepID=W7XXU1_9BACT|nr:agarase [Saccharicrinis fermentans]GAF03325.1 hypothetical protein JCM21142_41993 [Saccharicrinis fermentans DSM 9555 = JCM 21142]